MARSGYYAWRQRQEAPGERAENNAVISAEIVAVFEEHPGFYGSPRIHQELRAAGRHVGLHRVRSADARTPPFNDRFPQSNQLRAMPCGNPYNRSCESLRPVHEIGETPHLPQRVDDRGGGGQAGAPLPHHRDQRRELPPKGSCCTGFQGSKRPANVIDASAMAGTINSSTRQARQTKGGDTKTGPQTASLSPRSQLDWRGATGLGTIPSNLHSSPVVGPKPSPLTGQPD